jgi:hypothetical protein
MTKTSGMHPAFSIMGLETKDIGYHCVDYDCSHRQDIGSSKPCLILMTVKQFSGALQMLVLAMLILLLSKPI